MGRLGYPGFCLALAWAGLALAEAPRVVKAVPDDGAKDVDPATREIRVVFDRAMNRCGYSFVGGGDRFPEVAGRPRWVDETTAVLPVRLKPDHDYQLGINSERFGNFRGADGEPAVPYPIRFRTSAARAPAPTAESDRRQAFEELRRAIDRDYAYRDRTMVDWAAAFRTAEPRLMATVTPEAFAKEAATLLAPANDLHLWLKVGATMVPTSVRSVRPNLNLDTLRKAVPGWSREGSVAVGRFDDGIAYVLLGSWTRESADDLEPAFAALADARAVVVDVRPNSGGDETLARRFAGCFLEAPKVYARHVTRDDGVDSPPADRVVAPNRARPRFRGKSAVLMGRSNMSASESFLLMMKQVPGCTLIGERSYGSSGNPRPIELGNGVVALAPSWRGLRPDGSPIEGEGIAPDVEVKATPADFAGRDPVLDAALERLREP